MAHAHGHHHQGDDGHARHDGPADKTRILWAAILTGGFMLAEAIGGIVTGSLALLADAAHMLIDSVSLGLAWFAFHLAGRQANRRLTYGYDRGKTLVAYTNGLTVFAIGGWILWEAWHRFAAPAPVLAGPMLAIAVTGLAVNVGVFLILSRGDRSDLNMRGAILHVLGDLLGSVAAIAAAIVILLTGWYAVDPLLSTLVAVLLFRSAAALVRDSGRVLLEGAPDDLDRDRIARDIETSVAGVRSIHHMHVWSIDGARHMATLHARLSDGADAELAIGAIKARLAEKHGIGHATVEPDFGRGAGERRGQHLH